MFIPVQAPSRVRVPDEKAVRDALYVNTPCSRVTLIAYLGSLGYETGDELNRILGRLAQTEVIYTRDVQLAGFGMVTMIVLRGQWV